MTSPTSATTHRRNGWAEASIENERLKAIETAENKIRLLMNNNVDIGQQVSAHKHVIRRLQEDRTRNETEIKALQIMIENLK